MTNDPLDKFSAALADVEKNNIRLAVLEKEIQNINILISKSNTIIDKLTDLSGTFKLAMATSDARISEAERAQLRFDMQLEKYSREQEERIKDLESKQVANEKRIGVLENWRWYIIGAVATGFFIYDLIIKGIVLIH